MKAIGLVAIFFAAWGTASCNQYGKYDDSPYQHIHWEEEARLTDDVSSPYCDFAIDYTCLNEQNDSIAQLINRTLQHEFLGAEFASLAPELAVDSFRNVYIRDYREEVGRLYETEKQQASSVEEIPNWFNHTYSLVTFVEEGRTGIIHANANVFVDTGGAHPNQWSIWRNFDAQTGKLLTKEDVFQAESQKEIEQLLLSALIAQQAEVNPDMKVESSEDLQALGFLKWTGMYIPDNFFLSKNEVVFLFNRYDIAPYSAGEVVLRLPNETIEPFMKK